MEDETTKRRQLFNAGAVSAVFIAGITGAFNYLVAWTGVGSSEGLILVPVAALVIGLGAAALAAKLRSSAPIVTFGALSPFLGIGLIALNDRIHVMEMQRTATNSFLAETGLSSLPTGCRAGLPYRQMGYLDFECEGNSKVVANRMRQELPPTWIGPTRKGFNIAFSRGNGQIRLKMNDASPTTMNFRTQP